MAAEKHISVPKSFSGGDEKEWLQRFEICCESNAWTEAIKLRKLPTLLEGEALAVWLEMSDDEKDTYGAAKEALTEKLNPEAFVTLEEFHKRKMRPDETPTLFAYRLKKLLERARIGVTREAKDKLVLHQFLSGLPPAISRQIRATGETRNLQTTVERARLLLSLEEDQVAAVEKKPTEVKVEEPVHKLVEQVAVLTKQVEALTSNTQHQPRQGRLMM